MSDHMLIVGPDGEGFTIECLAGNGCNGWIECRDPHMVGDLDAGVGPYGCDDDAPWCDFEEWEFHGVVHTWRYGWGWTVPYPGCVVAGSGVDAPDDLWETFDGGHRLKPGRWLVDDDWDDEYCHLTFVGPARTPVTGPERPDRAVLLVGDWRTTCSACDSEGCGALFVGMAPAAGARIVPGMKPCGYIATLRPDLPIVGGSS